jgi:hypothetical protein
MLKSSQELVNFLGSDRSDGSEKVCMSDDRCLLLRVSDFFDGELFFSFRMSLAVYILNVCSRHYVVAEARCNLYHLDINIFPLSKKANISKWHNASVVPNSF